MANLTITNELARCVGLIANEWPNHSVSIRWHERAPENLWLVEVVDHADGLTYIVDDELGHWAPATEVELRLAMGDD
jgi:hypothetical protein